MERIRAAVVAALVALALAGCTTSGDAGTNRPEDQASEPALQQAVAGDHGSTAAQGQTAVEGSTHAGREAHLGGDGEAAVRAVVEEFGRRLKDVSLLAPEEIVAKSMEEHYGGLVSPELLERWKADPTSAPGRLVSSPWPDHIEVLTIAPRAQGESDGAYEVQGYIVEKSSTDTEDGFSATRTITLVVTRTGDSWLITDVILGDYVAPGPVTYVNGEYGFVFSLPESWEGYTVVTEKWEGLPEGGSDPVETGPLIRIRHPDWRAEAPRQDIPIMVFTVSQWEKLQAGEFHIGAAPVGPSELGRNDEYVFALPARYNYAFPEGWEEVEQILAGNPLQARKPIPRR